MSRKTLLLHYKDQLLLFILRTYGTHGYTPGKNAELLNVKAGGIYSIHLALQE
jgi:hypothetical protein